MSESNVTKPNPHLYWLRVLSAIGEHKSQQNLVTPLASKNHKEQPSPCQGAGSKTFKAINFPLRF